MKQVERLIAIAVLLACFRCLAGCTSAPKTDYTFSFQGDPGDYSMALEAAADWNRCGVVHVTVNEGGEGIPIYMSDAMNDPSDAAETDQVGADDADQIRYRPGHSRLIKHEMGHAFGLPHYGDALMNHHALSCVVSEEDCEHLRER